MHLAIIDENDEVFVEYDYEVFRKLLVQYAKEMTVEQAFEQVCEDLKRLTYRK